MNATIKTILNHRSIRKYEDRPIDDVVLNQVLESARAMPSSINGQQVSVVVVKDQVKKAKLAELAGGQPWVAASPVFLVFVVDFYKTSLAVEKTGQTQVIHESVEGLVVGTFDAGLAMGGAIVAAESLGLGIVPIGGIRNNPGEVIELLGLPKYTYPVAGLVIGHPADLSDLKPRMAMEGYIHHDKYDAEKLKAVIDSYDGTMAKYYTQRGDKASDWSSQLGMRYKYVYFPKVHPTARSQGFLNDK